MKEQRLLLLIPHAEQVRPEVDSLALETMARGAELNEQSPSARWIAMELEGIPHSIPEQDCR